MKLPLLQPKPPIQQMLKRATAVKKPEPIQEPPEHSIALRAICGAMAFIAVVAACIYSHMVPVATFCCVWTALAGCYCSYYLRQKKTIWVSCITVAGLLVVLAIFCDELFKQLQLIRLEPLPPFVHVLAGLLALHTFDLRTRSDINMNVLIGLGLLACAMVLGRDLLFGCLVVAYICLGSVLLFYECASRTLSNGRMTTCEPIGEGKAHGHGFRGSSYAPVLIVPIMTVCAFFLLPRVNSLLDDAMDAVHKFMAPVPIGYGASNGATASRDAITLGGGGGHGGHDGGEGGSGRGTGGGAGSGGQSVEKQSGQGGAAGNQQAAGVAGPESAGSLRKGPSNGTVEKVDPKQAHAAKLSDKAGKGEALKGGQDADVKTPPEDEMIFKSSKSNNIDDQVLFEIATPQDLYLRRIVFDNWDGHRWKISDRGTISKCRKVNGPFAELGGVPSLFVPANFRATEVIQDVSVKENLGHLIPASAVPERIDFPAEPVLVDDTGSLKSESLLNDGTHYKVVSLVANYDTDSMRTEDTDTDALKKFCQEHPNYLQVPEGMSKEITNLAQAVAGKDGNWFVKSDRICKFLRKNYKYSSKDIEPSKDKDLLETFLLGKEKMAACGPFATAFVVMCRSVGVPARCVGGFAPGDLNGFTGVREVKGKHGHAWGEIYLPSWGWVPFDATPTGVLPVPPEEDRSFMGSLKKNLTNLQQTLNPPKMAPAAKPPSLEERLRVNPSADEPVTPAPPKGAEPDTDTGVTSHKSDEPKSDAEKNKVKFDYQFKWWHVLVVLAVAAGTTMLVIAIRLLLAQRKRKKIGIPDNAKPSTVEYLRVVEDLQRLRIMRSPSDTANDFSSRFFSAVNNGMPVHPDLPPLVDEFIKIYTDERFGALQGSSERQKQLQSLGTRIHTLAKTRQLEKVR